jgi:broad specificity phosphatase PhoE
MTVAPSPPLPFLPRRRRIYLMRHGSVDYFEADGRPIPPHGVPLNAEGRQQADAAGALFASSGVAFDRVLTSGLPRTIETATRVLAAAGQPLTLACDERLQEIRPGRLDTIAREQLLQAFTGVFAHAGAEESASAASDEHAQEGSRHRAAESQRFLGGESIGELLDRVLPAFDQMLADAEWDCLLLVLHGGVNRALLARVLTGQRGFLGRFEQAPGCINLIDVGPQDMVLRAVNLAPTRWLHANDRATTMERLLAQYLRRGGSESEAAIQAG